MSSKNNKFYRFCKRIFNLIFKRYYNVQIIGKEHIPKDEPIELDYERTFQKMTYKTNNEKMYPNTSSNSVVLKYEDDTKTDDIVDDYGASVVRVNIRIF